MAKRIKENYTNIRVVGFELISFSSYQPGSIGRVAHKEFLSKDIPIREDMNISNLDVGTILQNIIVAL